MLIACGMGTSTRFIPATALKRSASEILERRRIREQVFGRAMFGEPAWEMLLCLCSLKSGTRLTITELARLASVSESTATRWVEYLQAQQLVEIKQNPADQRAAFVDVTERSIELMDRYLAEVALASG